MKIERTHAHMHTSHIHGIVCACRAFGHLCSTCAGICAPICASDGWLSRVRTRTPFKSVGVVFAHSPRTCATLPAVISVELRYRRNARRFGACYIWLKSAAFERQDGKFICITRLCDPSVIQRTLFDAFPPSNRVRLGCDYIDTRTHIGSEC